ncbi:MAG: tyrosine-type recombinase/integrase, partial [Solirubrobacteraceae bacterium]
MPRIPVGTVETLALADGTRAFHLRFFFKGARQRVVLHERPGCDCDYGCGGGWDEPGARRELGNIQARIRAGVWTAPTKRQAISTLVPAEIPTFHVYSSRWLQAKIDGVIGEKPISKNTEIDYRGGLEGHLLPFFARYRMNELDRDLCLAFKAHLVKQSSDLRKELDAGADIRDHRGRKRIPLGKASIARTIALLARILDEAIEDRHLDHNPARGKRMRIKVPKPKRTFLEIDELAALIDAAGAQDVSLDQVPASTDLGLTAARVAQLHREGRNPTQIASQLGIVKSTVTYHLSRLGLKVGRGYAGRRVVVEILGRSGVRVSELCDIKIGHLRLHDPDGARFRIPDSKTETGIREVQMTLDLLEAIVVHLDRLRRLGLPTGPDAYLLPNLRGGKSDRVRMAKIVSKAAKEASARLEAKGMPPLPNTTPHTLRRTYISIELLAREFDVKWVLGQVGHADSKMTMDVYAQLQQRAKRDGGAKFDKLVREAREQLKDGEEEPQNGSCPRTAHEPQK